MRFSIIIPTYNRAHIISKTIDSVLSQSYSDYEVILVDDGSTDNTNEVIERFKDPRIKYFKKENGERGAARNYGLERATGEYVNFFDSDDIMYSFHLEKAIECIQKVNYSEVICFPYDYLNESGEVTDSKKGFNGKLNSSVFQRNFVHLNGAFIKKSAIDANLKFIEDRNFKVMEDWYFFIRLAFKYNLIGFPYPTSGYIIHKNSTMSTVRSKDYRHAYPYFLELFEHEFYQKNNLAKKVKGEFLSMISLTSALENQRNDALIYLFKSFVNNPAVIFQKRILGILKNLLHA